jgi:hypothetical protein
MRRIIIENARSMFSYLKSKGTRGHGIRGVRKLNGRPIRIISLLTLKAKTTEKISGKIEIVRERTICLC